MKTPKIFMSLRRRLPLSREGVGWLALTVAIMLTGLVKGINLITLLACLFLAVGLVNLVFAWRQVRGVRIERELTDFLVAKRSAPWPMTVFQTHVRRRHGLTIVEDWPAQPTIWIVDLPAETEHVMQRSVIPARRGVVHLAPVLIRSLHPFGLALVERTVSEPTTLYVAPPLGQLERGLLRRWLSQRQTMASAVRSRPIRHPTGQMEFHGLRTFRSGDSPRLIHWRTSARRGELMVREFEEYPNDDLVLIVDLSLADPAHAETFERMLSLAATIVWEWCRQKGDSLTVVLVGEQTIHVSGVTSSSLRTEAMRAFAAARPVARVHSAGDLHVASTTAQLLLTVGASELARTLAENSRHALAVVDLAAGDDRDFFDLEPCETLST